MIWTFPGDIDHGASVTHITDDDIHVDGKVDGGSTAVLVSNRGSITIDGKVDHGSNVWLVAAGDIRIGVGQGGDNKVDGDSHVDATSGGSITLGDKIDGGHTSVDFKACGGISIGAQIDGGATVRLMAGTAPISVAGAIANSSTHVQVWPPKSLTVGGGIAGDTHVDEVFWAEDEGRCRPSDLLEGYWWQNWPQTFGYVSPPRLLPRSLEELTMMVTGTVTPAGVAMPSGRALKAVGGGWSFSDAALPFPTQPEVDKVSTWLRGATATQDMAKTLQGLDDATATPMDLVPELVAQALQTLRRYDQPTLSRLTSSGQLLPGSSSVQLIDTRALASSLQVQLDGILTAAARAPRGDGSMLFHVEAGITMADLQQLLDHQLPRMAIQASGGSPGATLAGTLSTATHGGEWQWPLLVDRVKAVHLVAPGGVHWWIEGDEPVADQASLQARYPHLDPAHVIQAGWSGIGDLTAQDVLDAVVVSMGTMGVLYSVVLAVVPQFGLQQIVVSTHWSDLLSTAGVTEDQLRGNDPTANQRVLDVVLDGARNGTGVGRNENVYADLAINPVNRDCWITNRRVVPIPVDSNSPAATPDDYLTRLSASLAANAKNDEGAMGRVLDFLDYGSDALNAVGHALGTAGPLARFLLNWPDPLVAGAAVMSAQTVANVVNDPGDPDRGQMFLGDVLTGFFNALEGTAPGVVADRTDVSYRVGAIGWPDTGVPGRGLEVAMDQRRAFSFLQNALFDGVLATTMVGQVKPMLGYISIRVCPPTRTLMGMQQYSDLSVMIEVVGYRSPEADVVMNEIQRTVLDLNAKSRLQAMLHWGLENHLLTADDLDHTPLSQLVRSTSTFTKLDAFRAVRQYLAAGHAPVFDNNFVHRLKL